MQLGVSSYSFNRLVTGGQMDSQLDVIAQTKALGFEVIEFSKFVLPDGETNLTFAPKVRAECDRVGLPVVNYTIAADFINGSGSDWQAEVERLKDEVRVAQILGAKGMRHDASWGLRPGHTGYRSFRQLLPKMVDGCRAVTEFAAELGIKTMVENHGFFAQDSDRVEELVDAVNHPNFGVLLDMGNFLCVDEAPTEAVGRLLPYIFHVHAKDFHLKSGSLPNPGKGWFQSRAGNYLRGAIIGHGEVPIRQCLSLVKKAGYDGVLSIEFEGMEDPLQALEIGLENLRAYLAAA
jgi:sugar phosphate isomerase/epimerase